MIQVKEKILNKFIQKRKAVSEQGGVEGQRKEVNVGDYEKQQH
jgi:hypothetical protein